MKRKKNILFGAVDIGYRIEHYTKYINNHFSDRFRVESFSKYVLPSTHYKTNYTYTCPIDKTHPLFLYAYTFCFFIYSLFKYDIFHFFSGETILTRKLRRAELAIYKLFGKRVIMHFVGSDIRNEHFIFWKEENMNAFLEGATYSETQLWQKKLIADAEKYADSIIVSTPDLKALVKNATFYPVLLDINKFLDEAKPELITHRKPDEIIILHSPSNTILKGTALIHEILKKLVVNSSYKIKLILTGEEMIGIDKTYMVTRYELFDLYKQADIVIDQLVVGWYGLQSIEALLMGKEVISYVDKELEPFLFPNCPIALANVNTLEQAINNCIERIVQNKRNYKEVIDWVQKYHTIEFNNTTLINAWGINTDN